MRVLGLDPGLRATGWGVIELRGHNLAHLACGVVTPEAALPMAGRLASLFAGLNEVIARWRPDEAAVEETFVNKNPDSTLKLGQARGVVLLSPALAGIPVGEYSANKIKKSVVGAGHADKAQIQMMVRMLLPGAEIVGPDAADALAVAICHSHYAATRRRWQPDAPAAEGHAAGAPR